jgi:hypothetical protein
VSNTILNDAVTPTQSQSTRRPDKHAAGTAHLVSFPSAAPETVEPSSPPELLRDPRLFDHLRQALIDRGYAGDPSPAMLAYVVLTSRLLPRPLNAAFVAPSGAGKTHAVDAARALMPDSAYVHFDAASPTAAIYHDRDNPDAYRHRILIFAEADSLPENGRAASALRHLISQGQLVYDLTEQESDRRNAGGRIVKNGPTGLITTSTRSMREQFNTRLLEVTISDDAEQTRAVTRMQALAAAGLLPEPTDTQVCQAAQTWLELHGAREVVIAFAPTLQELLPLSTLRIRRDFPQLLTAIKVIALLHQFHRERTPAGEVVATLDDYDMARELLAPIFEATSEDTLNPTVRETVEAIKPGESPVSSVELGRRLGLGKGSISYRVNKAIEAGYLENLEGRKGHPAQLQRTQLALPDANEVSNLPTAARVRELGNRSNGDFERSSNGRRART